MLPNDTLRLDEASLEFILYITLLHQTYLKGLIAPSIERNLTDKGCRVVDDFFGNTLDIGKIVNVVNRLRQGKADRCAVDAFVYDASEIIQAQCSEQRQRDIQIRERRELIPPNGTYLLGGIRVLREAIDAGLVTLNPPGSPKDQCYVRYVNS